MYAPRFTPLLIEETYRVFSPRQFGRCSWRDSNSYIRVVVLPALLSTAVPDAVYLGNRSDNCSCVVLTSSIPVLESCTRGTCAFPEASNRTLVYRLKAGSFAISYTPNQGLETVTVRSSFGLKVTDSLRFASGVEVIRGGITIRILTTAEPVHVLEVHSSEPAHPPSGSNPIIRLSSSLAILVFIFTEVPWAVPHEC